MTKDLTESLTLVRQAKAGDPEALNRLFARYYERVRQIVRVRLGKQLRKSVDSGDILQETFIAAVRSFENFEMREEASLINWLSKLAERQIIAAADYHGAKKRDRRREVPLVQTSATDPSAEFNFDHPGDARPPIELVADGEQVQAVDESLDYLPEDYRELILLRDYAGASWEMVAEQTGRPSPDAARMMHARAMIELGKLLRERGLSSDPPA